MQALDLETLTRAAELCSTDPLAGLALVPWLESSIRADAASGAFAGWGHSTVIDENTSEAVISPALFAALHDRASLDAAFPIGNAGLVHCYGYLLSLAQTPFGLKRERWLTSALATAYGREPDAFAPIGETTLLSRVAAAMTTALRSSAHVVDAPVEGVSTRIAVVGDATQSAVAYLVDDHLITTFPMARGVERVVSDLANEPPRLRWNAVR